ncbi:Uma2 family endonuclease [Streptomyces roseirectus]|uniref:Uma2 family endonuclease n=1 Tax=Streptomyces roseirectus TaxID=2768066 RepID=A0A7H0ICS7_9ACTN|nr:Uma2 family endonuclease [Streptomyces roseirectus]QNP70593.1 Uma2 family endonuclease [Streptomyces roseirectus]
MNEGDYGLADSEWATAVRLWERTDAPKDSRTEIIEGIVTVSPPPAVSHHVIVGRIQRRLYSVIPEDWGIYQTQAIAVPSRRGMLIPDLLVMPVQEDPETDAYLPAALAELVVEVTSQSNARHDRVSKPAAYAAAGIPLYLLVDRWADGGPTITLYGEPRNDVYRVLKAGKFGDPIDLPEPFDLTLDTSDFPHR